VSELRRRVESCVARVTRIEVMQEGMARVEKKVAEEFDGARKVNEVEGDEEAMAVLQDFKEVGWFVYDVNLVDDDDDAVVCL
jgi:hypothetical protein